MHAIYRFLPLAALLALAPPPAARADAAPADAPAAHPLRTWLSVNGNEIEASFVKQEEGKVYLRLKEGKLVATSRDKLSPNDLAWIDSLLAPGKAGRTLTFNQATQLEKNRMLEHRKVRRLFIKTYTQLTNNDRDDKALAYLQRDARSMYGWSYISADCYLTASGKKGKIKEMTFLPQAAIELREAVQMLRDKFMLVVPDPVVVKEVEDEGETWWELQNPPDYVSRVRLLVDAETQKIRRFDFAFPPPAK